MIKVSFQNAGGECDVRIVNTDEEARTAALEIISGLSCLMDGDKITVTEVDD